MTGRTPLLAQQAMRDAIDRALATPLTMREMKLFLAVMQLICHYDRTEDRLGNRQLAEATGIDERHVRRALLSLDKKGVITRTPGKGRQASLISVEGAARTRASSAPTTPVLEGADSDARGGRSGHVDGTPEGPASEVLSEASSEVCVTDVLARLKLTNNGDTPDQRQELRGRVAALVAIHGEAAVVEQLTVIPDHSMPFAGEIIRTLKAVLPTQSAASGSQPRCERCNDTGQIPTTGYTCGCPASRRWAS